MFNFEYMQQTVIMCAFFLIIIWDLYLVGYLTVMLVKWIWKKLHKTKAAVPEAETK